MARKLQVVINAETKRAEKNIRGVSKSVDGLRNSANRGGQAMSTFIGVFSAGGAMKALSGLSKMFTKIVKTSIATAGSYELQKNNFAVLLGSVKKGTKLFEELKIFSASTPLQLEDVTSGTQKLLAFGVSNEEVIDKMERLGNLALGQADKLDRLTNAYGKLKSKGRATLEELNLFTENGVPLMDELGKSLGVSTAEVYKLVSKGKIGFNDVDKAINNLTNTGGKFSGLMKTASDTLIGRWSTLGDVMSQVGAAMAENTLPFLKDLLGWATEVGNKILDIHAAKKLVEGGVGVEISAKDVGKLKDLLEEYEKALQSLDVDMRSAGANWVKPIEMAEKAIKELANSSEKEIEKRISLYYKEVQNVVKTTFKLREARKLAKEEAVANYMNEISGQAELKKSIINTTNSLNSMSAEARDVFSKTGIGKATVELDKANSLISLYSETLSKIMELEKRGGEFDATQIKYMQKALQLTKAQLPVLKENLKLANKKGYQTKEQIENEKKLIQLEEDNKKLRETFAEEYKKITMSSFEYEEQLLNEQYNKYLDAGINKLNLDKWLASEQQKLASDHYNKLDTYSSNNALQALTNIFEYNKKRKEIEENEIHDAKKKAELLMALNQKTASSYADVLDHVANQAMSMSKSIMGIQYNQAEYELAEDQRKIDAFKENREGYLQSLIDGGASEVEAKAQYDKKIEDMEAKRLKKEDELKKKQFESNKQTQIAQAWINFAVATTRIWAENPNPIFAAIITAMALATTTLATADIASRKYTGLYKGGIVPASGEDGQLFRLGDKNKAEVVWPLDDIKSYLSNLYGHRQSQKPVKVIHVNVRVDGFVGNEHELADKINNLLYEDKRIYQDE